jgi:general secretion pathway protein H
MMVALAIAGLLVGLAAPITARLYDSMIYRSAVSDLVSGLAAARYKAIQSGSPVDLVMEPDARRFRLAQQEWKSLPEALRFSMVAAQELSPETGQGAIRFYPDGSASGGSIEILRPTGAGVALEVDWLMGSVAQQPLGGSNP